ncbi:hypothetical protein L2E82_33268 [Cichorium intybus]|uniref:Uncharacterized protein n=1 Tax=Cichorium intybus TaxID=13427 RepID=A0ACB9BJP2_CICIN|nr:hypothetical protein L2E82_33268 [Cichorium intybus]
MLGSLGLSISLNLALVYQEPRFSCKSTVLIYNDSVRRYSSHPIKSSRKNERAIVVHCIFAGQSLARCSKPSEKFCASVDRPHWLP